MREALIAALAGFFIGTTVVLAWALHRQILIVSEQRKIIRILNSSKGLRSVK